MIINKQVKELLTNYPEFLADYRIICINSYITTFGDEYLILGVRGSLGRLFFDIICTTENKYLAMGSERYQKTIETVERLSLVEDCNRLLSTMKVAVSRSEVLTS